MTARCLLLIGGTDTSGGAGLMRDAAVARDLRLDARCVVTAVTAQTDRAVARSLLVPAELIAAQLHAGLSGRPPDAIKIGMLATADTVRAVASALAGRTIPVVLDPVLAATSGGALLDEPGRAALLTDLLPLCALVTPNLSEAAALAGPAPDDARAAHLRALGAGAVLIKGGHATGGTATDRLYDAQGNLALSQPRLARGRRGTGCTLATAIAGYLARGQDLRQACRAAKTYIQEWMAEADSLPPA